MMLMNKEEKIRALDYLDQKGVFKITKNQPAPVRRDADFQVYTV